MNKELSPKEIVLNICSPGDFFGKEAHSKLNSLAKSIHQSILDKCSYYEKSNLIKILYNILDEGYYREIQGRHLCTQNIDMISKVEKVPIVYRSLLETVILCPEGQERHEITQKDLDSLVLSAAILLNICVFSDYLHRNDFAGGFRVNKNGNIVYLQDNVSIDRSCDAFIKKFSLIAEKVVSKAEKRYFVKNRKRPSLKQIALPYDSLFIEAIGIDLSTIIGCAESIIFDLYKKPYGVLAISQNALVKKIKRKTMYNRNSIMKALNFLSINKELLSRDYQYFRYLDTPHSVDRHPIIRLFEGLGQKGDVVFLGRSVLVRALMLLISDLDSGRIMIGNAALNWEEDKGPEFEKEVIKCLIKKGFKAIRVTDPPSDIGEIDSVAFHEGKMILLVIESKAPNIDATMVKSKWHFERSREWCQKHDKKVKWAKENSQLLLERLSISSPLIVEVMGLIVTRVPWYVEPDLPYPILSFEEFEGLLERICST